MPNSVIMGALRAVEPGQITLGGAVRIAVPDALLDPATPLGAILTVVVHRRTDGALVAEHIIREKTAQGLSSLF